jgi:hypothetical protein
MRNCGSILHLMKRGIGSTLHSVTEELAVRITQRSVEHISMNWEIGSLSSFNDLKNCSARQWFEKLVLLFTQWFKELGLFFTQWLEKLVLLFTQWFEELVPLSEVFGSEIKFSVSFNSRIKEVIRNKKKEAYHNLMCSDWTSLVSCSGNQPRFSSCCTSSQPVGERSLVMSSFHPRLSLFFT